MATAISFGELLVDMVSPADASLGEATTFLKAPGGAPANVAVGLQKLGVPTAFIGMVGDDPFGDHLRDVLKSEGVDTSPLLSHSRSAHFYSVYRHAARWQKRYLLLSQPRRRCPVAA